MIHTLKIKKEFADAVASGDKKFELRFNDRNFQKGDEIEFVVIDEEGKQIVHALDHTTYRITYVLSGWGLQDGYVALGIDDMPF